MRLARRQPFLLATKLGCWLNWRRAGSREVDYASSSALPGYTRQVERLERRSERSVKLRLTRSQLVAICQGKCNAQAHSGGHIELDSGVEIDLRSDGRHDRSPHLGRVAYSGG